MKKKLNGMPLRNILINENIIRRFETKFMESDSGCWGWYSTITWKGYGRFHVISNRKYVLSHAHRISYIIFIGKIPKGMTIHHKCNNKRCVNPHHLTLLTEEANRELSGCWSAINRKKTHCINGHPFSGDNLYVHNRKMKNGKTSKRRYCKECKRISVIKYRKKNSG